ncbi:MAG TPA: sensor histidine kinase, partial [Thermoleophilaceae bacterium]|nr:sensor histidine kinase [Thermoleophilaceae bacterium]
VPWALLLVFLSRRLPAVAMNPFVAAGDFLVLLAIEASVPETYGAVRFIALFLVAAHAHFQGAALGLAVATAGSGALVAANALGQNPIAADLSEFYEPLFVVSSLATAAVVGTLRTAETTGRLRARGAMRRSFEAEDEVRKRLADALHDGPVQELVSLELMLGAARQANGKGDGARTEELLCEAAELAGRNVGFLRDEIVALGPAAFDQLSMESALDQSAPVWQRRFGIPVELHCERMDLPPDLGGALYRIAQEAVMNAGRHAGATRIEVSITSSNGRVDLMVRDDGAGFGAIDPLGANEPGHIGLASIKERAEAAGGTLEIHSGPSGTTVRVGVPLP